MDHRAGEQHGNDKEEEIFHGRIVAPAHAMACRPNESIEGHCQALPVGWSASSTGRIGKAAVAAHCGNYLGAVIGSVKPASGGVIAPGGATDSGVNGAGAERAEGVIGSPLNGDVDWQAVSTNRQASEKRGLVMKTPDQKVGFRIRLPFTARQGMSTHGCAQNRGKRRNEVPGRRS
jgi:hypothetical protein